MDNVLKIVAALLSILFLLLGLRWVFDPAGAAGFLGMPLLDPEGRGAQIADIATAFLALGGMIGMGVIKQTKVWFLIPAVMLMTVAFLRVVAWSVHDAILALDKVGVEVVSAAFLIIYAKRLGANS